MNKLLSFLAISLCAAACIYPYTPDLEEAPEGVLSVDGNICIGEISTVLLGQLYSLWPSEPGSAPSIYNDPRFQTESTRVWVEDDQGKRYPGVSDVYGGYLGSFTIDTREAPMDRRYRLHIEALGNVYTSDWSELLEPPVIKDIQFDADAQNVHVSVSLDGGTDGTGYMILNYDETWEFHVDYPVAFLVNPLSWEITPLESPDYDLYWCWRSNMDARNHLVDYSAMSGNGVSGYRLLSFPRVDNRNHRRYYINVKARTVSAKTYRFLKNLEENTNGGDNLFTPEPGEIGGNLHCESDPERTVLGYVLFSKTVSKRVSLDSRYLRSSPPATLYYLLPDKYPEHYARDYRPLVQRMDPAPDPSMGPFGWGPRRCYDCLAAGGTQKRPSFFDETE